MSFFQVFSKTLTDLTNGDHFSDPWTATSPRYFGSLAYSKGLETGITVHLQVNVGTDASPVWRDITDQDADAADMFDNAGQIIAATTLTCEIAAGWRAGERMSQFIRGNQYRFRVAANGNGGTNTSVVILIAPVGFGSH